VRTGLDRHTVRGIGRRQRIDAEVFGPDGIRFLFLKILALIVTADGHRKREPDDQPEKSERRANDEREVFGILVGGVMSATKDQPDVRRRPQRSERDE